MLKKTLLATACVVGLSVVAPISMAFAETTPTTTNDQTSALSNQISSVEDLIIQYQNDPDGLQAAIQNLVATSDDPGLANQAVVEAFNNSSNSTVANLLATKPALKDAGGKGLGAAIAIIAVNNPTLAASMSAYVQQNGGETFASSVSTGQTTSSIPQNNNNNNNNNDNDLTNSSTPETPASANTVK